MIKKFTFLYIFVIWGNIMEASTWLALDIIMMTSVHKYLFNIKNLHIVLYIHNQKHLDDLLEHRKHSLPP